MTTRTLCRRPIYWAARLAELRARQLRVPVLASVVETADALGFDVDALLEMGRASARKAAA